MDHQEVRDGNERIKKFMGSTITIGQDDVKDIPLAFLKAPDLKFHLAWKWLMPVVVKIEEDEGETIRIEGHTCAITTDTDEYMAEADNKIEAIWKAIVKYLDGEG